MRVSIRSITREGLIILLMMSGRPVVAFDWTAFGVEVMERAPTHIRQASDLVKARYVATEVGYKLDMLKVIPNASLGGRIWHGAEKGTCGDVSVDLGEVLAGAGIASRQIEGTRQIWIPGDTNWTHGAIALESEEEVYVIDLWSYAVEKGSQSGYFCAPADSRWNGMPLRDWVNVMRGKGYVTFLYLSANTPEKTERALRLYGEVTRSLARGIGPDTDTEHSEVDATAREKARLQQQPELWECIHGEWEEYEKSMKSIKRIRMPGAFSFYSCDPQHSAQDRAPEGCCKEYYASRNNPGMWKEAWLRLQECGWKERLEAARQSLGAKMDACPPMRGGPPPGER